MKVIIDPLDDILYKSFYIYGLEYLFDRSQVCYDEPSFSGLSMKARNSKSIRFIINQTGRSCRYVIACDDSFAINDELYNWCDVYGSVNANFAKTGDAYHEKLVSLCPSFAIKCWNLPQIIKQSLLGVINTNQSVRKHFGKYKRLIERPKYDDYCKIDSSEVDAHYVFFLSTLWYSDEWNKNDEGVNARRANFIRACKELDGLMFEGGLVSQGQGRSSEDIFADCLSKSMPMNEWMKKTRRSVLVFNTPAFWDCHGWKLGEYLAMGKCIVSTALSNDLPAPLEHGKHIHIVETTIESMRDAVGFIVSHPDYRKRLEEGARAYWEQYGTPVASLKLLGVVK